MSVHAPYNFVPLSDKVYFPPWADKVSHDVPFKDGLCGSLRLKITAHTPLLVGGKQTKPTDAAGEVEAFCGPDERPAIPGSTLKGMIRAVLEIASFGKMQAVDDRTLSIRDLTKGAKHDYGNRVSERIGGAFKATAKAGWLSYDSAMGTWVITPCRYARIRHADLLALNKNFPGGQSAFRNLQAPEKYRTWAGALRIAATVHPEDNHPAPGPKRGTIYLRYSLADTLHDVEQAGAGQKIGRLVFTGQPNEHKSKEFFFYDLDGGTLAIDSGVTAAFLSIHKETDEWNYWDASLKRGDSVPVFYLTDGTAVTSLGLAQMYKLAYEKSFHDMIKQCSERHLERDTRDLAETIFGRVGEKEGDALRGRVSFSLARLHGEAGPVAPELKPTVMASPKPSFVPSYVRQIDLRADGRQLREVDEKRAQYQSYMDSTTSLRGWKRYPVHPVKPVNDRIAHWPQPPEASRVNTQTVLKPIRLETGAFFTADLHFHNLRPMELGALLWVLTWGGQTRLRHSLGMGKPFGLGQISITVEEADSTIIANMPGQSAPNLAACQAGFVAVMDQVVPDWLSSVQMRQLCAMADPANEKFNRPLSYMSLTVGGANDFVAAKNNGYVLPEYASGPAIPLGPEPNGPLRKPPPSYRPPSGAGNARHGNVSSAPAVISHRAKPQARDGAAVRYNGEVARLAEEVSPAVSPQSRVRIRYDDGEEMDVPWGSLELI